MTMRSTGMMPSIRRSCQIVDFLCSGIAIFKVNGDLQKGKIRLLGGYSDRIRNV